MNINSSYINFGSYIIAIGVPVMLAYVYGVVPYSLCRGGTCGVKNDGGTFTFDFGSSTDENAGKLLNHSLETELWFGFLQMLYEYDSAFYMKSVVYSVLE